MTVVLAIGSGARFGSWAEADAHRDAVGAIGIARGKSDSYPHCVVRDVVEIGSQRCVFEANARGQVRLLDGDSARVVLDDVDRISSVGWPDLAAQQLDCRVRFSVPGTPELAAGAGPVVAVDGDWCLRLPETIFDGGCVCGHFEHRPMLTLGEDAKLLARAGLTWAEAQDLNASVDRVFEVLDHHQLIASFG